MKVSGNCDYHQAIISAQAVYCMRWFTIETLN